MGKGKAHAAVPAKGEAGFENHYRAEFASRWPDLKAALLRPHPRVVRVNAFADPQAVQIDLGDAPRLQHVAACHELGGSPFRPSRDAHGLLTGYVMDPASVLAARLVDVDESSRVLDLCAAPGGKSLILAERFAVTGELVLNDRSPLRRKRLLQVLKDYVPETIRRRIRVQQHDARGWGRHESEAYDAILLDAPCSSEAHVLADPVALASWSSRRIDRLQKEQLALLRSASRALRPDGTLVYCTCALAQKENDGVLELLLAREPSLQPHPVCLPLGEATALGWRVWPDSQRFGPIFVSALRKR